MTDDRDINLCCCGGTLQASLEGEETVIIDGRPVTCSHEHETSNKHNVIYCNHLFVVHERTWHCYN
jgi:hypothetical protein